MSTFAYFAYGSNMLEERLRHPDRCPSARVIGAGSAAGWRLAFTKRSLDDSGKATILRSSDAADRVHGVLFEIDLAEREPLDKAEAGYESHETSVVDVMGVTRVASVYVAPQSAIDPAITPYDWYRALVVCGARHHDLPADAIAALEAVPVRSDPNPARKQRLLALEQLAAAGCTGLVDDG